MTDREYWRRNKQVFSMMFAGNINLDHFPTVNPMNLHFHIEQQKL